MAVKPLYDCREFEGYLGNVGLELGMITMELKITWKIYALWDSP